MGNSHETFTKYNIENIPEIDAKYETSCVFDYSDFYFNNIISKKYDYRKKRFNNFIIHKKYKEKKIPENLNLLFKKYDFPQVFDVDKYLKKNSFNKYYHELKETCFITDKTFSIHYPDTYKFSIEANKKFDIPMEMVSDKLNCIDMDIITNIKITSEKETLVEIIIHNQTVYKNYVNGNHIIPFLFAPISMPYNLNYYIKTDGPIKIEINGKYLQDKIRKTILTSEFYFEDIRGFTDGGVFKGGLA